MSPSRLGLLEQLRGQPEPTTLAALVRLSGLHTNTVREPLDALVADGLVRRERALPPGPGRPAWLYWTTGEDAAPRSEEPRVGNEGARTCAYQWLAAP